MPALPPPPFFSSTPPFFWVLALTPGILDFLKKKMRVALLLGPTRGRGGSLVEAVSLARVLGGGGGAWEVAGTTCAQEMI